MKQQKNLAIIFILLFGILFIHVQIIGSIETTVENIINIAEELGLKDKNIMGRGIEYDMDKEGIFVEFVEEDAFLEIDGNEFINIIPNEEEIAFIRLYGDENNIIEADFFVNENGGFFEIEETEFFAVPNSRIYFQENEGDIEINVPNGGNLNSVVESLMKVLQSGESYGKYPVTIRGNNLDLPFLGGLSMDGALSYRRGQSYLMTGEEIILGEDYLLPVGKNDIELYFEPYFEPFNYNDKNYYVLNNRERFLHSTREGRVNAMYLPGNEFFNMNRRNYLMIDDGFAGFKPVYESQGFLESRYGFTYKNIPDDDVFLRMSVEEGDLLKAEEISETFLDPVTGEKVEKKIPFLNHTGTDGGMTTIENGERKFILTDELYYEIDGEKGGENKSVEFKLQSSSISNENYNLIMDSDNQFEIKNPDENISRISFSNYDSGIEQYPEETLEKIKQNIFASDQEYSDKRMQVGDVQIVSVTEIDKSVVTFDLIIALSREKEDEFIVSTVINHQLSEMRTFDTEKDARRYFEFLMGDFDV